jgi:urea transporter
MFSENLVLAFVDAVLRGYGQVLFMNNPISGLFYLAAYFSSSYYLAVMSLLGVAASTLTAIVLNQDSQSIRSGLFGYNGMRASVSVGIQLELLCTQTPSNLTA